MRVFEYYLVGESSLDADFHFLFVRVSDTTT